MSERIIINLSDLTQKVSHRGRKTTVSQDDIDTAQALDVQQAFHIEEFSLSGDEFATYRSERIARYHGDEQAVNNAWTSRHRQRVSALAKASDVDLVMVVTEDGEAYASRRS